MLEIERVSKRYASSQMALLDVSFQQKKGEFVFIMGHSGSGKSTLMKLIYGAEKPTSGSIRVLGKNVIRMRSNQIASLRRNLGIVFQDFKLIQTKTVWENVAFALEAQGASDRQIRNKVSETLSFVGLNLRSRDFPTMLSGGEQQRVAIARALVNDPQLLLADEPTGNLDETNAAAILKLLLEINNKGTSVLVATHDQTIVESTKMRIVRLDHGQKVSDGYAWKRD
jgi:cell division transport system ATP-binding protein